MHTLSLLLSDCSYFPALTLPDAVSLFTLKYAPGWDKSRIQ